MLRQLLRPISGREADRAATCPHCGVVQRVNLFDYWLGGGVSCQSCPRMYEYDAGWRPWLGIPLLILSWPIIFHVGLIWFMVKGIIGPPDDSALKGRTLLIQVPVYALGLFLVAIVPAFIILMVLNSLGWI